MRVVFAGTPAFAAEALNALISSGLNVVAAYTQPDRPAGRGMKLTPSAVKTLALTHAIPVFQPASLKSPEAQTELASLSPDVMVVAAYGLILPQAVLDIPRLGCLNIHASLLPRWRGAAPIQRSLLAGDSETGVCIMRMEAGLDTGAVLLEARTPIGTEDTAGDVHDRLASLGANACVNVLKRLAAGERIAEIPQSDIGVTYAQKISVEEARLDWSADAATLDRMIRAFNPVPGAWSTWREEKLKLWRARVASTGLANKAHATTANEASFANAAPGTLIRDGARLFVACGPQAASDWIELLEIQRPGGKRIAVSAWLSGSHAPDNGERLQ